MNPRERCAVVALIVTALTSDKVERPAALVAAEFMAKVALDENLRRSPPPPSLGSPPSPDEIPELARAMVRERYPDLDPNSGAAAARRWKRLVRLAEVVHEQQMAQVRGEKSPTAVIAKTRGVAPSTVRGWLHQANLEGFTPAYDWTPGSVTVDGDSAEAVTA